MEEEVNEAFHRLIWITRPETILLASGIEKTISRKNNNEKKQEKVTNGEEKNNRKQKKEKKNRKKSK